MIKLETKHAFLKEEVKDYQPQVDRLHRQLMDGECLGNDYIGWVEWPNSYDREEFERIKARPHGCAGCAMSSWCAGSADLIWGRVPPSR